MALQASLLLLLNLVVLDSTRIYDLALLFFMTHLA